VDRDGGQIACRSGAQELSFVHEQLCEEGCMLGAAGGRVDWNAAAIGECLGIALLRRAD
jgi:hypothetical protein